MTWPLIRASESRLLSPRSSGTAATGSECIPIWRQREARCNHIYTTALARSWHDVCAAVLEYVSRRVDRLICSSSPFAYPACPHGVFWIGLYSWRTMAVFVSDINKEKQKKYSCRTLQSCLRRGSTTTHLLMVHISPLHHFSTFLFECAAAHSFLTCWSAGVQWAWTLVSYSPPFFNPCSIFL